MERFNIRGTEYDRSRKFTGGQIEMMKMMREQGCTLTSIAEQFGTYPSTVRYAVMSTEQRQAFCAARYAQMKEAGTIKRYDFDLSDYRAYKQRLADQGIF